MKKILHILPLIFILVLASREMSGQGIQKKVIITWKGVQSIQGFDYKTLQALFPNS